MTTNIILILSCLGSFLIGFVAFWLANKNNLVKDITKKRNESVKIISNAKNKAFKIQKDMEKKAKQYKENQIKKVKDEVSHIRQEIDSKEKDILTL